MAGTTRDPYWSIRELAVEFVEQLCWDGRTPEEVAELTQHGVCPLGADDVHPAVMIGFQELKAIRERVERRARGTTQASR